MIMEFVLGLLLGCLLMMLWLVWDLHRWGEWDIDLSMGEIENDLWSGLHHQRGDD